MSAVNWVLYTGDVWRCTRSLAQLRRPLPRSLHVPWLLTCISEELAIGRRLGPIDDADGAMDDDQGLILDGAAVAAHSEDHLVTPVKARSLVGKIRWDWDFSGAWTTAITQGPRKGTTASCEVESIINSREVGARIQGGHVHGGL